MAESAVETGRRERKRNATRRAIRLAALRLAVEHGPESLTVQAISDAANIGLSTFFTYFSSRDEVFEMEVPWTSERLRAALAARPPEERPLVALRELVKEIGVEIASRWEEAALWKRLARTHPKLIRRSIGTHDDVLAVLVEALSERMGVDPEQDVGPMLTVGVAMVAARVAIHRWSHAPEPEGGREELSIDPFVDEAFGRLERGL